ncbi:MAG: glycosyltransferase [Thermoleophilia bacterium]|nr:glycosyltransferase [Thermoleophilia bacterium]
MSACPRSALKLAMFAPSMTWGGAEKMFRRLAMGFAQRGFSVDLVLASATGPNLEGLPTTIRVVDLGVDRVRDAIRPLARYIDDARPDALLSTLYYANIAAVMARSLSSWSPLVILREATSLSVGTIDPTDLRHRMVLRLAGLFYPRADVVVANSHGAARDLVDNVGIPKAMVRVIYNPAYGEEIASMMQEAVDHPWFGDGGPPLVLSVGRLNPPKRYDLLIRAVCAARQQRPLRLVILGDGEERARLESVVRERAAEEFVSLPGFATNPYAYMARSDLFVLSSIWEGLPNALIEAMGCGLKVVSTDCPHGPREILGMTGPGRGAYGTLAPCDDVDGLCSAILCELGTERDPDALRRRAMRFGVDRAVTSYLDLVSIALRGRLA